ncbi:carbohydrate-selective porin : Carbohydrate-selective porin OprB OS=Pedosphaera parvula (strain Ellin514) GN=Cflav_PD0649 PE=4 SV=1: OprB [Gemmata massiliana]|uniref:Porin n=1 Tax=Gemmata massiliana TaxID=1210884 RepID=A0A6P2CQK3_9BACT|nr:carbohydrate porin [Gemmata massiliana]VTR91231.1 carbohydrate-selective porin : Carbohydrate-selective porin OprB OS=Pedosphaera parvula (strain Ellin514) GN=Cflav_PD0649 PE=4 SV=1: OprB [Gemmata massiliana]
MRKLYFGLLATVAVGLTHTGRGTAQNPPAVPPAVLPDGLPTAVPADPLTVTQPPAPQPGSPGAFDALQGITGCAPAEPPTPPAPPPYGGPFLERQKLLGGWFGARERLRDHGVTLDIHSTNIISDLANGGLRESFQQRGRIDYLMHVDGEKAGLWKGSFIDLHAEMAYGTAISGYTGALEPANIAQILPTPNGYVGALTGVKFTQALSERFITFFGKINTAEAFNQPFTGGALGVDGFMNGGLTIPAVLVRTIPYSTYGAGFAYLKGTDPVFSFSLFDANNTPTRDGFDTFFDNGVVFVPQINIPTKFFGLPGHQGITGSYSTKRYGIIDRTAFINPILGLTAPTKSGSWALTYNFDQTLYAAPDNLKRSWGTFGNLGLADQNPSPFRWFANIGFGGSSPIASRKLDTFGVGYYYLGLNNALQNLAPRLLPFRDHEQGVELFYNCAVTPWCHLTPDVQFVIPAQKRADALTVFGLRAKIDF